MNFSSAWGLLGFAIFFLVGCSKDEPTSTEKGNITSFYIRKSKEPFFIIYGAYVEFLKKYIDKRLNWLDQVVNNEVFME